MAATSPMQWTVACAYPTSMCSSPLSYFPALMVLPRQSSWRLVSRLRILRRTLI